MNSFILMLFSFLWFLLTMIFLIVNKKYFIKKLNKQDIKNNDDTGTSVNTICETTKSKLCIFHEIRKLCKKRHIDEAEFEHCMSQYLELINVSSVETSRRNEGILLFDQLPKKYTDYCLSDSIPASAAALRTINLLGNGDSVSFINNNKNKMMEFLDRRYDRGFSVISPELKNPTNYGNISAINAIKFMNFEEPSTPAINGKEIPGLLGKRDSIINFIKECKHEGLVLDEKNEETSKSVCVLHYVLLILWNLDKEDLVYEIFDEKSLTGFLEKCAQYPDGGQIGVASNPDTCVTPSLSPTYFFLQVMSHAPNLKQSKFYESIFSNGAVSKISCYLESCWNKDIGGFSATSGSLPFLRATYHAFLIIKLLQIDPNQIDPNFYGKLSKFITSRCFVKDDKYGAGFAMNIGFPPTAQSSRYAMEILKSDQFKNDNYVVNFLNENHEKIEKFIKCLYNKDNGGFSNLYVSSQLKEIINENIVKIREECEVVKNLSNKEKFLFQTLSSD